MSVLLISSSGNFSSVTALLIPRFRCSPLAKIASSTLLIACWSSGDPAPVQGCHQIFELGNTGCFEIVGIVVGIHEQPLAGISVGPHYLPGKDGFTSSYVTSDANGRFTLRAAQLSGGPPSIGPDTMSLWIVGIDPTTASVGVPPRVRDSVLAQATISGIGSVPAATSIRLGLPAPELLDFIYRRRTGGSRVILIAAKDHRALRARCAGVAVWADGRRRAPKAGLTHQENSLYIRPW